MERRPNLFCFGRESKFKEQWKSQLETKPLNMVMLDMARSLGTGRLVNALIDIDFLEVVKNDIEIYKSLRQSVLDGIIVSGNDLVKLFRYWDTNSSALASVS